MATITVVNVEAKSINTKFGPKNKFIFVGADGNRYEAGWKNHGVTPGATIEANINVTKYGNELTDIRITTFGGAPSPIPSPATPYISTSAAPVRAVAAPSAGFPLDPTSREISIIRQNALTNAVKSMENLYGRGVEMDEGQYVERVLNIARQFADYTSGHDLVAKLAAMKADME
jgi:hypothetical protein